jgi:hypothetical protein
LVVTVDNGKIVAREQRGKMGHAQFAGEPNEEHSHEPDLRGHGFYPAAQNRHARMATTIADCDVLLARGMGAGAYYSMEQAGIRPIITDIENIEQAVQAVITGQIKDHTEKLH